MSARTRETLSLDEHGISWRWMARKNIRGEWVWYICRYARRLRLVGGWAMTRAERCDAQAVYGP
jgi:hypothetical protein